MTAARHVSLLCHSQGMMKVAVCPDISIFELGKVHFTVPHAHLFYSSSGLEFSLSNRKVSFCLLQLHHFPRNNSARKKMKVR